MSSMTTPPAGKRQQTRARITTEILDAARAQLAEVGAAGLSLRSVAREIGMVSSAVYRYVASRDELLTRLIIEAYDSLGEAAERAARRTRGAADADRWLAVARAVRAWALAHPHEYELLYGSPVPGYAAPPDTVDSAIRPTLALVSIVRDSIEGGRLAPPANDHVPLGPRLTRDLGALASQTGAGADPHVVLAVLTAWTQLFGLVGFELTNQTRGLTTDDAGLFDAATRQMAHAIGLR